MKYAKEAYEAYCRHTGWKSLVSGKDLPQWDDLPLEIQKAWEVSTAWVGGLWTANGVHEGRLNLVLRNLIDASKVALKRMEMALDTRIKLTGIKTGAIADEVELLREAIKAAGE